jgi:hypothetical protein
MHYFAGDPLVLNAFRHDFGFAETRIGTEPHAEYDLDWEHAYNELFELIRYCGCNINQF